MSENRGSNFYDGEEELYEKLNKYEAIFECAIFQTRLRKEVEVFQYIVDNNTIIYGIMNKISQCKFET